ncbi:MAG: class I SAM-dependent methyltransferase, partial [Candidatus Promineifilaceae bacterium]
MTTSPTPSQLIASLELCAEARTDLFDERHTSAFRLFNGFVEGYPELAVDLYGKTALIHHYGAPEQREMVAVAQDWLQARFDWLQTIVVKQRKGATDAARRGVVAIGKKPDRKIREHGVWYSADLLMNRDASFYLDTRNLRRWILDNLSGKTVLNTFAYTGSLGVAAVAAGATRVVQSDLNRQFLNVAKTSHTLNGFAIDKKMFVSADFFPHI